MEVEKTREQILKEFDDKIADAIENKGAIEVRDLYIEKAEFFKDKKEWDTFREILDLALTKTVGASKKLELNMEMLQSYHVQRNGLKYKEYLKVCKTLEEEGSDWEMKNKLAIYKSIENLNKRNFKLASEQMISTINTYNSPEIISFNNLVFYSTLLGILSQERATIDEKLIKSSDVMTELRNMKDMQGLLNAYHKCNYQDFFPKLLEVRERVMADEFLKKHEKYILRQSRIIIYTQFMESYKTVTLDNMAQNFGVSAEFIDRELSEFIASKKINCKIDKLKGIIESQKTDSRLNRYDEILKKGDLLIEKMHKLARIAQS